MNTEVWNPKKNDHSATIDDGLLRRFIEISRNNELTNISAKLNDAEKNKFYILNLSEKVWHRSLVNFNDSQLLELIKFFVLIEMQLPNWKSGEKSPVILINKILRKNGVKLDRDTLLWIRNNSSNRYIPNGKIL